MKHTIPQSIASAIDRSGTKVIAKKETQEIQGDDNSPRIMTEIRAVVSDNNESHGFLVAVSHLHRKGESPTFEFFYSDQLSDLKEYI